MTIVTKYSINDTIWFLFLSELCCSQIINIEISHSEEYGTKSIYQCLVKNTRGQDMSVLVQEQHAFESKDELINTITERFYKSIESGSA